LDGKFTCFARDYSYSAVINTKETKNPIKETAKSSKMTGICRASTRDKRSFFTV
jgi:hypothetical protein